MTHGIGMTHGIEKHYNFIKNKKIKRNMRTETNQRAWGGGVQNSLLVCAAPNFFSNFFQLQALLAPYKKISASRGKAQLNLTIQFVKNLSKGHFFPAYSL